MAESSSDPFKGQPPFGSEYAKSGRSSCKGCKMSIKQGELRMSVRTKSSFYDGLQDNWFHFECFWNRAKSELLKEGNIRGMESLKWDDQELIRERMAAVQAEPKSTPKSQIPKFDLAPSGAGKCFKCKEKIPKGGLRVQYKVKYHHLTCLEAGVISDATTVMGFNSLDEDKRTEAISVFGDGKKEEEKKSKKRKTSEDSKDEKSSDEKLKKKLENQSKAIWEAKGKLQKHFTDAEIKAVIEHNRRYNRKRDGPNERLEHLTDLVVFGVPTVCPECDGQLFYSPSQHTYRCNGNVSEYTPCEYTDRNPPRLKLKIPKDLRKSKPELADEEFPTLNKRVYAKGTDVITNALTLATPSAKKRKKRNSSEEEGREIYKNGCSIDSRCEVAEVAHVYTDSKKVVYQAFLHNTVVSNNTNSYYKLQLLEHDRRNEYFVFRAWGRIGTDQGGALTNDFGDNLEGAISSFETLFFEKTANKWSDRKNFTKKPGKFDFMHVELDGLKGNHRQKFDLSKSKSKLAKPIQHLLNLILDVEVMQDALKELHIDVQKMPLGKLSVRQITAAYSLLKEIEELIESSSANRAQITDASNRFYTAIPHNTGAETPPLLDNLDLIREKSRLLDELSELEVAYSIIREEDDAMEHGDAQDPIDMHYAKIGCDMDVLDPESETYKMIVEYANKTHAPTHTAFKLKIQNIFVVSRKSEDAVFRDDIGNVHLLWHGSRISNYASILSKGLRIAPPEAPPNGYMFGKGVYFADMVSKSAQYCYPQGKEKMALLLLSDVALGKSKELKDATHITKLDNGFASVKGLGATIPNPETHTVLPDGVKVPIGKPTKAKGLAATSLLYNEYIVYNEAQVRLRYLVQAQLLPNYAE